MRYPKKAMIVAPQPEAARPASDIHAGRRQRGRRRDRVRLRADRRRSADVRHRRASAAPASTCRRSSVHEIRRLPRARARRRAARHVGAPGRGRGARRLRLRAEGAASTTSATSRSACPRACAPSRRCIAATARCPGRRSAAGDRMGRERLAGAAGTSSASGSTKARWAARQPRAPALQPGRRALSTAAPTARPGGSARS